MERTVLADLQNWQGTYYELAIPLLYDFVGFDAYQVATRVLWAQPQLQGPWEVPDPSRITGPAEAPTGFGLLSLPGGQSLPCEIDLIPELHGDWLDLSLPLGMVETAFSGHPTATGQPWREVVNSVLVQIAEAIFREVPFNVALIGEAVSNFTDEHRFRAEHLARGGILLSPQFCEQAGVRQPAVILPSGLRWFPPPTEA